VENRKIDKARMEEIREEGEKEGNKKTDNR